MTSDTNERPSLTRTVVTRALVMAGSALLIVATAQDTLSSVEPHQQLAQFNAPRYFHAASLAHGISVADLDADGNADLVVAAPGASAVAVLLGRGDRTFAPPLVLMTGRGPKQTLVADVNGDGALDIISANQDSTDDEDVTVLLGHGDGTFAAPAHYAACSNPHQVAVGDLNADGVSDIAVACWGESNLALLYGSGDGSFQPAEFVYSGGDNPHGLIVADLNGDGALDIAVAALGSSRVGVLLSTEGGGFAEAQTYPTGSSPHSIKVHDLDGDGFPDLVTPNQASNDVSVLINQGDGTFVSSRYPAGWMPKDVAIGDLDEDGYPDIVTADIHDNYPDGVNDTDIAVLYGRGDGTFTQATSYGVERTPFGVTVSDVDGDGHLDVITANWHTDNVAVLYNTGLGGLVYRVH